jgi:CheY-like chemotaxis protein
VATRRIVVVDDEEDVVRSLERRLAAAIPNTEVEGLTSPRLALQRILERRPHLIVTDVRMPELTGMELLIHARERWGSLPFVVMTAFPTERARVEASQLGSVHFFEKPFKFDQLVAVARDLLVQAETPGFSGAVSSATLPDLVQLFCMSGSSGVLRVWHLADEGAVWFDRGAIVHARAGRVEGREAVLTMVAWEGGRFAMELDVAPPTRTVKESTTGLMLDALRRADDRRRGTPSDPNLDAIEIIETADLDADEDTPADRLDDLGFLDLAADGLTVVGPGPSRPHVNRGDITMATNTQVALEKLRAIDGYIGACIVDSESAMSLALDGGGAMLNLEVAAAGNAEVVKAKRKAMRALGLKDEIEDILVSLGKQYHLIRPLRMRNSVFVYLALDRARANLAMARLTLSDVERTLEL